MDLKQKTDYFSVVDHGPNTASLKLVGPLMWLPWLILALCVSKTHIPPVSFILLSITFIATSLLLITFYL